MRQQAAGGDARAGGLTNDSTPTFTFSAEPRTIGVGALDAAPVGGPCDLAGPTLRSRSPDGPHTFAVHATDDAGARERSRPRTAVAVDTTTAPAADVTPSAAG